MNEKKRKIGTVVYASDKTPVDYKCDVCGATGVKLWREYAFIATLTGLYCAKCAGKEQNVDISAMTSDGLIMNQWGSKTDQIGGLLPAIPVEGQDTYWGYTSIPTVAGSWWRRLPNAVAMKASPCCDATVHASLADGVVVGSCSKCGKMVVRLNPATMQEEDLAAHGFDPWYDVP